MENYVYHPNGSLSDRFDNIVYFSNAIASLEQLQQTGITLIDRPNGETNIVR
ncbi:MAG: hypothetical protein AB4206_08360 [Xenococcaceae cyanobacterium]